MAVAMTAIGAAVHVLGRQGTRTIPLPGLHCLPGEHPERDTVLARGDLITAIELPPLAFARRSAYRKVRDRASFSFAVVSIAAAVALDDDRTLRECRIAFGGVAHVPWRATRAEEALRGTPATAESFASAADAELEQAQPLRDNGFKVGLARNLLVGTLSDLCEAS
jgi:xanthine dehydrogenase YagS FAD-binding subunit